MACLYGEHSWRWQWPINMEIISVYTSFWASQVAPVVRNLPANAWDVGDMGLIPGLRRCPGGGHGNPLQYFAWRIPWTKEPTGLQSLESQRVRHDWSNLAQHREVLSWIRPRHSMTSFPSLPGIEGCLRTLEVLKRGQSWQTGSAGHSTWTNVEFFISG